MYALHHPKGISGNTLPRCICRHVHGTDTQREIDRGGRVRVAEVVKVVLHIRATIVLEVNPVIVGVVADGVLPADAQTQPKPVISLFCLLFYTASRTQIAQALTAPLRISHLLRSCTPHP